MITLQVTGGLGNQMFIYAFGRRLQSLGYKLRFDTSAYKVRGGGQDIRNLEIVYFKLNEDFVFGDYQSKSSKNIANIFARLLHRLRVKSLPYNPIRSSQDAHSCSILESQIHPDKLSQIPQKASIQGYFINLSYFQNISSKLSEEFTLKNSLSPHNQKWQDIIHNTPHSTSLHIRRGDYLKYSGYTKLGQCYYTKAIQIIKERLGNPHFFIFSNDIQWCKDNLPQALSSVIDKDWLTFVEGNDEGHAIEEMELMRSCEHAIVANSTFSWWAAYLMKNPRKICIMPSSYSIYDDVNKILPLEWILIDPIWGEVQEAKSKFSTP